VLVTMRRLDDHAATDDAIVEPLELGRLLADAILYGWRGIHIPEADLQWNLHVSIPAA
jgi:hypothetical protein